VKNGYEVFYIIASIRERGVLFMAENEVRFRGQKIRRKRERKIKRKVNRKINRKRYRRRKLIRAFLQTWFAIISIAAAFFIIGEAQNFVEKEPSFLGQVNHAEDIRADLGYLHSRYAVLVDLESGKAIREHNSQDKIYPASMTKIMTAILAMEQIEDFYDTVTLPCEMFEALYAAQASLAGFLPGERVRLKDLLYGALLPSGAECCLALADYISGSESQFADLMNEKAKELGMAHTHFCNSTGLHDSGHYSTVADIAILLRYALQNEMFREAFTCSRYSTAASNLHPDGITFCSTMFKSMESNVVTGGEILGGKTGYTQEAGLCLASLAKINGKEYILVTAKADRVYQTEPYHVRDAIEVYSQLGAGEG